MKFISITMIALLTIGCGTGYFKPKTVAPVQDLTKAASGSGVFLIGDDCVVRVAFKNGRETRSKVDRSVCQDARTILTTEAQMAQALQAQQQAAAKAAGKPGAAPEEK